LCINCPRIKVPIFYSPQRHKGRKAILFLITAETAEIKKENSFSFVLEKGFFFSAVSVPSLPGQLSGENEYHYKPLLDKNEYFFNESDYKSDFVL
jgi:hypothetical protein